MFASEANWATANDFAASSSAITEFSRFIRVCSLAHLLLFESKIPQKFKILPT